MQFFSCCVLSGIPPVQTAGGGQWLITSQAVYERTEKTVSALGSTVVFVIVQNI